jgi:hypothetical protein
MEKSKKEYLLAITAHFFDDNLNYRSLLYSFRKFNKYHYSNEIRLFIIKKVGPDLINKVNSLKKLNFEVNNVIYR